MMVLIVPGVYLDPRPGPSPAGEEGVAMNLRSGVIAVVLLKDGVSIERALASIRRGFLLDLSAGFVYDVLRDRAVEPDMAMRRRTVLDRFTATVCVDELHLGRFTLLLAKVALADLPVALALVER
jgi:hypothetical protein